MSGWLIAYLVVWGLTALVSGFIWMMLHDEYDAEFGMKWSAITFLTSAVWPVMAVFALSVMVRSMITDALKRERDDLR